MCIVSESHRKHENPSQGTLGGPPSNMLDMCVAAAWGPRVRVTHTQRPQLFTETGETGVKVKSVTIL